LLPAANLGLSCALISVRIRRQEAVQKAVQKAA
jgi:hypothetical protein